MFIAGAARDGGASPISWKGDGSSLCELTLEDWLLRETELSKTELNENDGESASSLKSPPYIFEKACLVGFLPILTTI